MRKPWLVLAWALVLGGAAAIRLQDVSALGLSHWDEGAYTAGPLHVGPYARAALVPFYAPPLYPMLVGLSFKLFGESDTVAILCATISGVLSIGALGLLASRLFGSTVALIAATFLATTEFHIAFCRMALTDATFLLFFLLALWLYLRAFEKPKSWWSFLAGYVAGLALFTKYHGFLACGTAGLYLLLSALAALWRRSPDRRERLARLGWVTLISGLVFALMAAALAVSIHMTVGFPAFFANRTQWMAGWHLWSVAATARFLVRAFGEWISPALLVLAGLGAIALVRKRGAAAGFLACWVLLFLAALPAYKNYPRLLLPLVPAVCVLAALGLQAATELFAARARPALLVAGTLVTALLGFLSARDLLAVHNSGYRRTGELLSARSRPGMTGLAIAQHNLFFYLRRAPGLFYSHNERPEALLRFSRGEGELIAVDLRLQHAADYEEILKRDADRFELIETIPNELNEFVIVNHGGFALLDRLRANPDSDEAKLVREIRVYRRR